METWSALLKDRLGLESLLSKVPVVEIENITAHQADKALLELCNGQDAGGPLSRPE
jgi:hypothetical protein